MNRIPIAVLLPAILALAWVLPSLAQDIRLSPPSYTRQLPTELKIQSAGRLGGSVLVAWGTSALTADSEFVGEVWVRALGMGASTAPAYVLHSSRARPFGFTQVIPLASAYLVVWNDRRADAPGIYGRLVDTMGKALGEEYMMSRGSVIPDSVGRMNVFGDPSRGLALVWSDRRDGVRSLRVLSLDSLGRPRGSEQRLGGGLLGVGTLSRLPGLRLLSVSGGPGAIAFDDGRVVPAPVLGEGCWASAYLDVDTSLAILDSNRLRIYRSPFDTAAGRVVWLPALDGAVKGSLTLSRDSSGDYRIHFATVEVTGNDRTEGRMAAHIYVLTTHGDSIIGPRFVDSLVMPNGRPPQNMFGSAWVICVYRTTDMARGCDNSSLVHIRFTGTHYWEGEVLSFDYATALVYQIDGGGKYAAGGAGFQPVCDPTGPVPPVIVRSAIDTASVVVLAGADAVTLQAPTAPLRLRYHDHDPALVARSGQLLLCWLRRCDTVDAMSARLSRDTIISAGPTVTRRADGVPYGLGSTGCYEELLAPLQEKRAFTLASGDGQGAAVENSTCTAYISKNCGSKVPRTEFEHDACTSIAIPTIAGWRQAAYYAHGPKWYDVGPYQSAIMGYDPDRRELLARVELVAANMGLERHLLALDDTGAVVWKIDAPLGAASPAALVPIDSALYLSVVDSHAVVIKGRDSVASFELPGGAPGAIYRRLHGARFLRLFPPRLRDATAQGPALHVTVPASRRVGERYGVRPRIACHRSTAIGLIDHPHSRRGRRRASDSARW